MDTLSAKMPATMDATQAAKKPATMESDAPPVGGGNPNPPQTPISRDSQSQDAQWVNMNEAAQKDWQTGDKKTGPSDGWSSGDRKEGEVGGYPQRA